MVHAATDVCVHIRKFGSVREMVSIEGRCQEKARISREGGFYEDTLRALNLTYTNLTSSAAA